MATLRVSTTTGDLVKDMTTITTTTQATMARVVKRNTTQGRREAQAIARAKSGIHGKNYYKRITDEMLSPLVGEYGPHGDVAGNAVGAGWRHGPSNTDLPKSADIQGPKFAKDVSDAADGLFWPGAR